MSPTEQCSVACMLEPQRSTKRLMHTQAVTPFQISMVHLLALLALLSIAAPPAVAPTAFQFFVSAMDQLCMHNMQLGQAERGLYHVILCTVNTAGNR